MTNSSEFLRGALRNSAPAGQTIHPFSKLRGILVERVKPQDLAGLWSAIVKEVNRKGC